MYVLTTFLNDMYRVHGFGGETCRKEVTYKT